MRAKRATFTFPVDKRSYKMPKMVLLGKFLSISITRQGSLKRAKINEKCDILCNFQTMCD